MLPLRAGAAPRLLVPQGRTRPLTVPRHGGRPPHDEVANTHTDADDATLDERDLHEQLYPGRDRRRRVLIAALFALSVAIVLVRRAPVIASWWRGETDLLGRWHYNPRHAVSRAALGQIAFLRVHAELMPAWFDALRWLRPNERNAAHDRALAALRTALRPDANLDDLVVEMDARIRAGIDANGHRLRYLVWAWNDYLDRRAVPYRVEVTLHGYPRTVALRAYQVVADAGARVGSGSYRSRVLLRVDGARARESFLGHGSERDDGALVMLDRVHEFATDDLWPLLDASHDAVRDTLRQAHGPGVRREVAAALPPDAHAILLRTAPARRLLLRTLAALNDRQACTTPLHPRHVPWNGLLPDALLAVERSARGLDNDGCLPVQPAEAEDLRVATRVLADTPGLEDALQRLEAWLARAVAVHEARHVADDRRDNGLHRPLPCPSCPASLRTAGRAEMSAYLAAFATPGVAYTSYYQACAAAFGDFGPNVDALEVVTRQLSALGCDGRPPPDLESRARTMERIFFHRDERVVPPGFPERMALAE